MLSKFVKSVFSTTIILTLVGFIPAASLAAPAHQQDVTCSEEYTVQTGDWLSRISERFLGDITAYPAIVDATNAQAGTGDFQMIDNPNVIEVGWTLCIPAEAGTQAAQATEQQATQEQASQEQAGQMEEQEQLTAPEGEMLMVVRNQSKANAPSTFTISGGEYAGGEQITVNHGEEMRLELEPGDYRVIWSSPEAELDFGRTFTAVPGTVATARIIPEKGQTFFNFNVNQQEMTEQQAQQMETPEAQYEAPEGQMLLVLNNFSKANAPSTFTISGGEYAGGEQITVNHGEEVLLRLEPADYRVTWSSPASDLSFSRRITAVPGTVTLARIIPEEERAIYRSNVNQDQMQEGQAEASGDQESMAMDEEFPFEAPEGRGLIAVTNRSLANLPSTLTLTGGRFGGGEQFTVNPGEEVLLPVDPGTFTIQWSAPVEEDGDGGETVIVSREVTISAGEAPLYWIVPEEFRAFIQTAGEAPVELEQ